ncbi:MAG TPA: hypothetical protein VH590_16970 [Ktedonobacterales bacterium]|jgi:hypothetical protein
MSQVAAVSQATSVEPRLSGRWLRLARGAWLLLALLLLANFIASIPVYYQALRTLCTAGSDCNAEWLPTQDNAAALQRLGLSLENYAAYFISVDVAVSLVFWIVGLLIFWRKSHEWLGLFVSFVLIMYGSYGISDTLQTAFWGGNQSFALWSALDLLSGLIQWASLGIFLVAFPTGRFMPRWTWLVVGLWVVQFFMFAFGETLISDSDTQGIGLLVIVSLTYGSTAGVLIYRYARVFTPVQRQQSKWVVFGVATGVLVSILANVLTLIIPELGAPDSPYQLLGGLFTAFLFLPIPLCTGIAIMRYRLWDIDAIINKALVYGLLTALLGTVYAGLIIGLVSLASAITGTSGDEPIALVIATLAIAALFQPVRRRIQAIIDRRFYRRKYDAEKTLAAFSATLRSEVDLEQLRAHLLSVVNETMRPAHVSLWLRQPERPQRTPMAKED